MSARSRETDRAWQIDVWDRMAQVYQREIDTRFAPVIEQMLIRADLQPGEAILDLGAGTGALAFAAAERVGPGGRVTAIDISPEMLKRARARAEANAIANIAFVEGGGEAIPARDREFGAVLASLSLMYVLDRAAASREIARVLAPGGRFVAAVWGRAEDADIVLLQQTAGSFALPPPVSDVGPGALADPTPFISQLAAAGLTARVETETTEFRFANFDAAWNALAGVTVAGLDPATQDRARAAVRERMWPSGDGPRVFHNRTQFVIAKKSI